jgi:hypothetical protein
MPVMPVRPLLFFRYNQKFSLVLLYPALSTKKPFSFADASTFFSSPSCIFLPRYFQLSDDFNKDFLFVAL